MFLVSCVIVTQFLSRDRYLQPLGWKDLFLVFLPDSKAAPAVVRTAANGVSCIVCHSETCSHICTIMQVLNEPTHDACVDLLLLALSDAGERSGSGRVHHPVSAAAIDAKSQLQLPPVFPEEVCVFAWVAFDGRMSNNL